MSAHLNVTARRRLSRRPGLVSHATIATFAVALAMEPGQEAEAQQTGTTALPTVTVEGSADGSYRADSVESPKQTAPLLDTPQTVHVIPSSVFREQGATDLTEVLRNTPGISFNAGENGFVTSTNNFSLRGFDTSGGVFVDGARSSGSYTRDIFNVEQVEVFKGPAADNGRGGAGGYINLQTKTPRLDNFVFGNVGLGFDEYDSELRTRATLDANRRIGETTALRLNLMIEDGGIAGREEAEQNAWGFAPSLSLGLGTDLRATFAYEHVEHDDLPDWGVPGATVPGLVTFNPATGGASRDAFYGLSSDYDDVNSDAVLARFEWDFSPGATLSNQTRWSKVDRDSRYTLPTGYTPATDLVATQTQFYDRTNTSISNITNLSLAFDTAGLAHKVATGIELTREESEANRYPTPTGGNTPLRGPNPGRGPGITPPVSETNKVEIDTLALYAYDTIVLSPQFEITGGLRAEWYDVTIDSQDATGTGTGTANGYEESDFNLGGKIGLVYKPARNGSVYVSFGVSDQPPGSFLSNPDISRTGDNAFPGFVPDAKTVTNYNYELGTKWDFFNNRFSVTGALFRTEKHNVAITGREGAETVDSLKGYGKQIVQGIELGVAGEVLEGWNVFGGVVLMDSERKHSAYLDQVRRNASPGDYGAVLSTDGDELAFTPRFTANLWTTYRFPVGLTLGAGVNYVGSSYLGRPDDALRIIPNDRFGKLPEHTVVSAMIAYDVTENVDVRLNIENIFDETYAQTTNWSGSRAALGAPRSFILSTGFSF